MLLIGGLRTPGSPPDPPSENEHFELAESAVTLFEGGPYVYISLHGFHIF